MSVAPRTASARYRLGGRTLGSLLRYKFLHEYGYDKGEVVVAAIVADICEVVDRYYSRPEHLQPGQVVYHCPAADERARKGKTMGHTRLVPVRLTLVAHEDIDAIAEGLAVGRRREIRLRRLAHEAYAQGGVLSELDLSVFTGYSEGGVSAAVVRMRERGEILPLRGYVADMGSWPTHKAAIVRLYLEGLTTPEIASRTYHSKRSVDRYIEGFERVRLLEARHPREELPLLTGLSPNVVAQYLAILRAPPGWTPQGPPPCLRRGSHLPPPPTMVLRVRESDGPASLSYLPPAAPGDGVKGRRERSDRRARIRSAAEARSDP